MVYKQFMFAGDVENVVANVHIYLTHEKDSWTYLEEHRQSAIEIKCSTSHKPLTPQGHNTQGNVNNGRYGSEVCSIMNQNII